MTYFKVDDHFHSHPKILTLGLDSVGLWTLAGSWSGEQLTDGFIPASLIARLGGSEPAALALVDAGLWETVPNGYQFHDWEAHNQTKAQVEESRELWRMKKEKQRAYRTSTVKDDVSLIDESVSLGVSLGDTLGDSLGESLGESRESPGTRTKEQGTRNKEQGTGKEVLKKEDENFCLFWQAYPRKAGKAQARVSFAKVSKACDPRIIITAAERFALDPNREDQFTPHPTTWLNQGRWDDDPLPAKGGKFHDTMTEIYAATQREGNLFQ
jgi:hypothetical protein